MDMEELGYFIYMDKMEKQQKEDTDPHSFNEDNDEGKAE